MKPQMTSLCPSLGFIHLMRWQALKKSPGPNKTVCEILWCAAAAPRIEWYLNNTRQRHSMNVERLTLLPAGTTSNESLHAEINNWFRQTQVQSSEDTYTLAEPLDGTIFCNIDWRGNPLEVHELTRLLDGSLTVPS
jgi:hypothetical protein